MIFNIIISSDLCAAYKVSHNYIQLQPFSKYNTIHAEHSDYSSKQKFIKIQEDLIFFAHHGLIPVKTNRS